MSSFLPSEKAANFFFSRLQSGGETILHSTITTQHERLTSPHNHSHFLCNERILSPSLSFLLRRPPQEHLSLFPNYLETSEKDGNQQQREEKNIKKATNMSLNGRSVLITGGTGSLGKKLVETILKKSPKVRRLVVLSRDELKQFEMAQIFSQAKYPCMRYFLGDVRDVDRLKKAFQGIDVVIHAAALKQVPAAEYNPFECIKTNVLGAQNVIDAALECGVESVVALSTDKAAAPINLYGATKLCSDKLFVAANLIKGSRNVRFSVVRYGNVMGSRGSVIPFFMKKKDENGALPITDPNMTRFNISLEGGVAMVLYAVENAVGGEIFVPKIPSYRIVDVAKAVAPKASVEIVGIRPGEKMHEEMITASDSPNTVDLGEYFAIVPQNNPEIQAYYETKGTAVKPGFSYNSGTNTEWLSVGELSELVKTL